MNNWNFVGRIGQDREVKYTDNGTRYVKFSVAIDRSYYDKNKAERVEVTQWVGCIWFTQSGISDYLSKGAIVQVEGEPSASCYNDKAYQNCKVRQVELLTWNKVGHEDQPPQPEQEAPWSGGGEQDDMPF